MTESLTRGAEKSRKAGSGCLVLFFAVFALAGLAFSSFFAVGAWKSVRALSWRETPCTLLASSVRSHGDTFSVAVRYAYALDGRAYTGERFNFLSGSSSAHDSKAAWVAAHPAGSRMTCWVNPADPNDAVLQRGLTWEYLFALIPGVFVAVGVGGGVWAFRGWRRERRALAGPLAAHPGLHPGAVPEDLPGGPASDILPAISRGPVTLDSTSPVAKFFGLLAINAVWNGLTGVFVWKVVEGWREGAGDGCLTAFMIPFALVGILLLVSIPHQFLAMFNPRPRLALDRGLRLGEGARLSWRWHGRSGRVRRLKLVLTGMEQASYRRGTSTTTESKTFASIPLLDTDQPGTIPEGSIQVTVPADSMHTFQASNNKILWRIDVEGEIPGWPDVAEQFPVDVGPAWPGGRR
jgi:hypothetical protein